MPIVSVMGQGRLDEIDADLFVRIRMGRLAFLFRGAGQFMLRRKEQVAFVREYGLVIPMFIVQLLGYVVGVMSLIMAVILRLVVGLELTAIGFIVSVTLGVKMSVDFGITVATIIVSRRRKKKMLEANNKRLFPSDKDTTRD